MQAPEPPDPEERRAERDVHAPRAALLFPVTHTVGQSVSS
jgi:hypothetical protein